MQREGSRTPNRSFGGQVIGKAPGSAGRGISGQKTPGKSFQAGNASKKSSASRNLTPSRNLNLSKTPAKGGDRYCPNRSAPHVSQDESSNGHAWRSSSVQDLSKYELGKSMNNSSSFSAPTSPSKLEAARAMSDYLNGGVTAPPNADVSMAGTSGSNFKILGFQSGKAPAPPMGYTNGNAVLFSSRVGGAASCRKASRHIPSAPDRVLDAPFLGDDFYLNLIDWSADNALAVGLGNCTYIWYAGSGEIDKLVELESEDEYISSTSWSADGAYLAVGLSNGNTELYDQSTKKRLRTLKGTEGCRVGSLAWNAHIITTGASNGVINHFDVRQGNPLVLSLTDAHTQEVCGLKWSPDGRYLASGGNDNRLLIWTAEPNQRHSASQPLHTITDHQAAVKALAWCPWQSSMLASGGGTADRTIKCWNVNTAACLASVDAESQVSALLWSNEYRELISSHGYPSHQLTIWKYPQLTKVTELAGHTERVLGMALSGDGQRVVSAGADESLRIWNCFARDPAAPSKAKPHTTLHSSLKPHSQLNRLLR